MATPIGEQVTKIFDFRINLVAILALGGMVFGAAAGYSKLETRDSHDADIKSLEQQYVRRDIYSLTDSELRQWLNRIEQKLDERNRQERRATP